MQKKDLSLIRAEIFSNSNNVPLIEYVITTNHSELLFFNFILGRVFNLRKYMCIVWNYAFANSLCLLTFFRWTLEKDTGHLIAYHLKKEDEGKYVCIAENNAGRIETETFLVINRAVEAEIVSESTKC